MSLSPIKTTLVAGGSLALAAAAGLASSPATAASSAKPTVIILTQTGCQFVESENGVDHGFKTSRKADCIAINKKSSKARLSKAKTLNLKPGKYIFRVTNKNVPYELGFWLRGRGLIARATLPTISGGGLVTGKTQDYAITLKEGRYLYSCPLNTTPNYRIVVKG